MSHAFHQLYYHIAWATHSRDPHIHRCFRPELLQLLHDEVKTRGGVPMRHNAMPDHVHLLAQLPPTVALSEFIGHVKGALAFRVNRYIDNQEQHHGGGKLSVLLEQTDSGFDCFEAGIADFTPRVP